MALDHPETAHGRAQTYAHSDRGAQIVRLLENAEEQLVDDIMEEIEVVMVRRDNLSHINQDEEPLAELKQFALRTGGLTVSQQAAILPIIGEVSVQRQELLIDIAKLNIIIDDMKKVIENGAK